VNGHSSRIVTCVNERSITSIASASCFSWGRREDVVPTNLPPNGYPNIIGVVLHIHTENRLRKARILN